MSQSEPITGNEVNGSAGAGETTTGAEVPHAAPVVATGSAKFMTAQSVMRSFSPRIPSSDM